MLHVERVQAPLGRIGAGRPFVLDGRTAAGLRRFRAAPAAPLNTCLRILSLYRRLHVNCPENQNAVPRQRHTGSQSSTESYHSCMHAA